MNYLFRTFDPIVRTIYYECGGKRITEKEIHPFRISFPAHTFVMCFSDYNKELRVMLSIIGSFFIILARRIIRSPISPTLIQVETFVCPKQITDGIYH